MIIEFPGNTRDCTFTYIRNKVGGNYFVCYYKNSSCLRTDPIEVRRILGLAKFTSTGQALKDWAVEMVEKYGKIATEAPVGIKDTSFASEALDESDPNYQTRTIT